MERKPSSRKRRRPSYSSCILRMSSSPYFMASMAAYWLMVGADMMPYWCSFTIWPVSSFGAQT